MMQDALKKLTGVPRYKVFVTNKVGCESTWSEGERVVNFLKMNGHEITDTPSGAEYLIVNTCTFVESGRLNLRKLLKDLTEEAPAARLIVMGCVRDIAPELLSDIKTELRCGLYDLEKLDSIFANQVRFNETARYSFNSYFNKTVIVACRGCRGSCTYCSIRRSIGKLRSRETEDIVGDIQKSVSGGEKNFLLAGDDVGFYGLDISSNLPALLEKINKIKGDFKVSLGTINPQWINLYLEEIVSFLESDKAERWIFMPIQSANNRVLKTMGRDYTIEECIKSIKRLQQIEGLKFFYDIMIGFPTESDAAFRETVKFILDYPPSDGMIAVYSREKETPAFKLPSLDSQVLKKRREIMVRTWRIAQGLLRKSNPAMVCRWGT